MNHLNLIFPEWQGYGVNNLVHYGAHEIKKLHTTPENFKSIDVVIDEELIEKNNILGYDTNINLLAATRKKISDIRPSTITMIGGTCASEIAPVSYLNKVYDGNLLIVWFDAHGDLNTPESSGSKHFHGMPLRALLGESDPNVLQHSFSKVAPDQITLVGTRDLDDEEVKYIQNNKLEMVRVEDMASIPSLTTKKAYKNVYLHIDLDVLDPEEFPYMLLPVSGGLSIHQLLTSIEHFKKNFNVVGTSIVEYVPKENKDHHLVKPILDALIF